MENGIASKEYKLNTEDFEKFFFYGMENRKAIYDAIILLVHQELIKNRPKEAAKLEDELEKKIEEKGFTHKETKEQLMKKTFYNIEKRRQQELILQLERFVSLNDKTLEEMDANSIKISKDKIEEIYQREIKRLEQEGVIAAIVKYPFPRSGIFFSDREEDKAKGKKLGREKYDELEPWAKEKVYPILCYLAHLEKKDPYVYYALFLDTQYARTKDRFNKATQEEKEKHKKELKNIQVIFKLIVGKTKKVFANHIKQRGGNLSQEIIDYIDKTYPIGPISDLKDIKMIPAYEEKLQKAIKEVKEKEVKELDSQRERE